MLRTLVSVAVIALLANPAFGQSTPAAFEIADVHASPRSANPNVQMRGGVVRNGVYEIRQATMLDLIRTAYGVDADKVVGGPNWLELDRFDVTARTPAATSADSATQMLRALLADRFKLAVREEKQEMATWVLSVAGKPKKRPAEAGPASGCQPQPEPPNQVMVCRSTTVAQLAELLPRSAGAYVNTKITDSTGLTGAWDFELKWTARALLAQAGADGISLFDALDKQLGLKLEQQKLAGAAFVVDSVNRTPTANPTGVEKVFPPPPPPEFEVAEIKPTAPGNQQPRAQILPSGQVNAVAVPLMDMVYLAWGINNNPDLIAGPSWMREARFDIIGKAFSNPADASFLDLEIVGAMLRSLLIDRFKITSHYEDRSVNGYTLTATPQVRMTKADPASRTKCWDGPKPGDKDLRLANPALTRLLTCQNVTMAQFAERLQGFAGGYVRTPIADATGLEGGWNLVLNFSPIGMFPGGVDGVGGRAADPNAQAGAAPAAPTGALTLPEALERQLGLKMEMRQRPMSVLVIDQISEKPTDN